MLKYVVKKLERIDVKQERVEARLEKMEGRLARMEERMERRMVGQVDVKEAKLEVDEQTEEFKVSDACI